MNPDRAQPVFGRALAAGLAVALGMSANACAGATCTDTIFVDGFDGGLRSPGRSPAGPGARLAVVSDGFDFYTLEVHEPGSLALVGSSQGSVFHLAFVDADFDRVFGLAEDFAVSPDMLASIRLSDAAITPIGTASPHEGNWLGIKQDPVSGELYALSSSCPTSSALYTIDRSTAAPQRVGELVGIGCAVSITIDAHGDIYAIDAGSDELFAIDRSDLSASPVGPIGFDAGEIDMDFDGAAGTLYVAGYNNSAQRVELRTVDPQSGASALVGTMPIDFVSGFAIGNDVVCSP
jgi:hypothetical protein